VGGDRDQSGRARISETPTAGGSCSSSCVAGTLWLIGTPSRSSSNRGLRGAARPRHTANRSEKRPGEGQVSLPCASRSFSVSDWTRLQKGPRLLDRQFRASASHAGAKPCAFGGNVSGFLAFGNLWTIDHKLLGALSLPVSDTVGTTRIELLAMC